MERKRLLWPDITRIIAVYCMIVLHTVALSWTVPVNTIEFHIFNIYDSIVRPCVPIFIMISGMFFLDPRREQPIKKLLSKNCLRIATAFAFWSFIYTIQEFFEHPELGVKHLVKTFILGRYHMWFPIMLIGLYLIVPILKKLTADKKITEYFLLLAFIFNIVAGGLLQLPAIDGVVEEWTHDLNLAFVGGNTIYFILGSYMVENDFSKKTKRIIYVMGVVSLIVTILATSLVSIKEGQIHTYYGHLLPNIFFVSIAMFLFAKDYISQIKVSERGSAIIQKTAQLAFCVYLVHDLFLTLFCRRLGITALFINPIFGVPVVALMVFIPSLIVAYIIDKIPVLRKYIM